MTKFDIKWLDLGTPLFLATYINLALFITSYLNPAINQSINTVFNTLTNNYWDNVIKKINSNVLINIFNFYSILIIICSLLFFIALILYEQDYIMIFDRVNQILGWVFVLCMHQFNILLLVDYYEIVDMSSNLQMLFTSLDISVFILFTYIFLNSYDLSEYRVNQ
ncbi:hypothetical protein JY665_14215 [Staphylococcus aureus]|uniref:hypothetical protein n=1 Tax=Staphylococcus aureus TaxID=1280 RepID=UPI0004521D81|nr:hypothetical protein [Staphylococcus aureus]EVJ48888.1 hypothetical protein U042_02803 [Staphylococcus aureus UCIM6147]MBG3203043.1 hypothetical protein [Staphylococcus aureus]MBN5857117.1 hypothetical protein [Staphylococcus aureus]MBN5917100.1 hypothetical protein [Staphylococcus aureus]